MHDAFSAPSARPPSTEKHTAFPSITFGDTPAGSFEFIICLQSLCFFFLPLLDLLDICQKQNETQKCDSQNACDPVFLRLAVFAVKLGTEVGQDLAILAQKGCCDGTCRLRGLWKMKK